ncbi:hypothetical protein MRX96_016436 [Rhipicephalus microplus]
MFVFEPSSTRPHRALLLATVSQQNQRHHQTRAAVTRHRSGSTGNREGLYVIISELGVSIPVFACVLTYSFANYTRSKRNAQDLRQYIASTDGVDVTTGQHSDGSCHVATDAGGIKVIQHRAAAAEARRLAGCYAHKRHPRRPGQPVRLVFDTDGHYSTIAFEMFEQR